MTRPQAERYPNPEDLRRQADIYCRAKPFIDMVMSSKLLTRQEKHTLRGQALHGDLAAARKGYENIIKGR